MDSDDDDVPSCSNAAKKRPAARAPQPTKRAKRSTAILTQDLFSEATQSTVSQSRSRSQKYSRSDPANLSSHIVIARLLQDEPIENMRCGKLLSLDLVNFMCHSNFHIDFSPRINFMVGSNGSGKSAILAAIMLGLGSRAKSTTRSTSVKDYIKTGEANAKISIKILNSGHGAFHPEIYGNIIKIVRSITGNGSTIQIRNEKDIIISRKMDDLNSILMYHNLQPENPVFILTQNNSREFLKDMNPQKNYEMFKKANQLDVTIEKYNQTILLVNKNVMDLVAFENRIKNIVDDLVNNKSKLKSLLSNNKVKNLLAEKLLTLEWLIIKQQEDEIQMLNEKQEETKVEHAKYSSLFENRKEMHDKEIEAMRETQQKVAEQQQKLARLTESHGDLRNRINRLQDNINNAELKISSAERALFRAEDVAAGLRTNLANAPKKEDVEAQMNRDKQELEELKQKLRENEALMENAKRDGRLFIESKFTNLNEAKEIQQQIRDEENSKANLKALMNRLKSNTGNKLAFYHDNVKRLREELFRMHKAGKLSECPRLPIGAYIEVPNNKYRNVVEHVCKPVLEAVLIANAKDRIIVENLLSKKYPNYKPTLIQMPFHKTVHDIRNGRVKAPRGSRCVFDEIVCNDPVVMNLLIDRVAVETILVADTNSLAEHLTMNTENVPMNLQKVIVQDTGEFYPAPMYRFYSLKLRDAKYIQVNSAERIKQIESSVDKANKTLATLAQKREEVNRLVRDHEKLSQQKKNIMDAHIARNNELQQEIEALQEKEYQFRYEGDFLTRELNEAEENVSKSKEKFEKYNAEKKKFNQGLNASIAEMKAIEISVKEVKKEINQYMEFLKEGRRKNASYEQKCKDIERIMLECKHKLETIQRDLIEKTANLGVATEKAEKVGARVDVKGQTESEVKHDISRLKARIKSRTRITETQEELEEKVLELERKIQEEKIMLQKMTETHLQLKETEDRHFANCIRFQQYLEGLLNYRFSQYMRLNEFKGSLEINRNDNSIKINVVPRDQNIVNAVSSTKALSGGERSFSTVAFLATIWQSVDHPFFMLDEYDVFTDEYNRAKITQVLINQGKDRPDRQFFFLTPLDMNLESDDSIVIHRLSPPERN